MVTQQLQRNDVEQALQTVDGLGHTDCFTTLRDTLILLSADDDRLRLTGCDLCERGLDLGVQRVLGHDDNDGHVLVNES